MNPGKLRHRITFQSPPIEQDSFGELSGDWVDFKTVWASKQPILGNEYFTALTTESGVEVKFNCRYTDGVTNDMRISHGTEVYEILSAINVKSLNRELLCYCKLVK